MPELNDSLGWMVATGAAVVVFLCMVFLTRNLSWWWLKWVLRLIPAVALILPVGVPEQPGYYAPAMVVAPFEAFLQENGQPGPAVARLVLVLGALLALITLAAVARAVRRRGAGDAGSAVETDAQSAADPAPEGESVRVSPSP